MVSQQPAQQSESVLCLHLLQLLPQLSGLPDLLLWQLPAAALSAAAMHMRVCELQVPFQQP